MPIYNGEAFVADAIESVLGQTFRDFEFLIIDDGSTDGSVEIVEGYADSRIRLVRNERQTFGRRKTSLPSPSGKLPAERFRVVPASKHFARNQLWRFVAEWVDDAWAKWTEFLESQDYIKLKAESNNRLVQAADHYKQKGGGKGCKGKAGNSL